MRRARRSLALDGGRGYGRAMAFVQASDGRRLAYETRGEGRALVCVPGGPGVSSRLLGDLGGLDRVCRLVLVDQRGTGGSDPPLAGGGYSLAEYAADVERVCDHLKLARIALLGHSAGAIIAMTYAASYPERVEQLVLVGGWARFAEEHEAIAEKMRESYADEPWYADAVIADQAIAAADHSLSSSEFGALFVRAGGFCFVRYEAPQVATAALLGSEGVNVDAWLAFDDEDFSPLLRQITAPTLVITGEQDCVIVPAASREVADELTRGRLVMLPDAGHYSWVDQPDAFRATVSTLLDDPSAKSSG
jgi:proline iminopeptidase